MPVAGPGTGWTARAGRLVGVLGGTVTMVGMRSCTPMSNQPTPPYNRGATVDATVAGESGCCGCCLCRGGAGDGGPILLASLPDGGSSSQVHNCPRCPQHPAVCIPRTQRTLTLSTIASTSPLVDCVGSVGLGVGSSVGSVDAAWGFGWVGRCTIELARHGDLNVPRDIIGRVEFSSVD